MVNKQLLNWIKNLKTKGYSNAQITKHLTQQGYQLNVAKEALKSLTRPKPFSLTGYLKSISSLTLILFITSFLFLAHSFNFLILGLISLTLLGISLSILDHLYKKNKEKFGVIIISLAFAVLFLFTNQILLPLLFFIIILIKSFVYFKKSDKGYNLTTIFLSLFISLVFAATLSFLALLLISYGIIPLFQTINELYLNLILSPLIIVFFSSFLIISIKLLQRCGCFNHNAYFRHKHFPFKILNIFSSDNLDVKKSIIKTSSLLIFFVLFLAISVSVFLSIDFVDSTYGKTESLINSNKESIESPFYRYEKIVQQKGFKITQNSVVFNGTYYGFIVPTELGTIFYNCDVNLNNCESKAYESSLKLDQQVPLDNSFGTLLGESIGTEVLFILPKETIEKVISHNFFEFEDSELRETKIALEINEDWTRINKELLNEKTNLPITLIDKVDSFNSGKVFDSVVERILFTTKLGITKGDLHTSKDILIKEFNFTKKNLENGDIFYDGTEDIDGHLQKIRDNVNLLYPKTLNLPKEKIKDYPYNSLLGYNLEPESLYEKAQFRITKRLRIFKAIEELGDGLSTNKDDFEINTIKREFQEIDIEESKISKVLRLKLLETRLKKILKIDQD